MTSDAPLTLAGLHSHSFVFYPQNLCLSVNWCKCKCVSLSSVNDLSASSIMLPCGCHISHASCLRSDATSLPSVRVTLPSPSPLGVLLEVLWGHNLPNAPLGFPEPWRPRRTLRIAQPGNWSPARLSGPIGSRPVDAGMKREHHTHSGLLMWSCVWLSCPSGDVQKATPTRVYLV